MSALKRITANNPSPMTLEGTNSFILRSADRRQSLLIDPGPELHAHKRALLECIGESHLAGIILTHHHADHSEMLGSTHQWAPQVPVYAVREKFAYHTAPLLDGDVITFGDTAHDQIQIISTPGHTDDSISIIFGNTLLSGDTILGRGTTVIMYPEGSIADYLASMKRIRAHVDSGRITSIEPAHGPQLSDPMRTVTEYISHRTSRLEQVQNVLDQLGETVIFDSNGLVDQAQAGRVADIAYAEVPAKLRPAVLSSVSAQLEYLGQK